MSNVTARPAGQEPTASGNSEVQLGLRFISVLSTAKIAFLFGLVGGVVGVLATVITYNVLNSSGAFRQLQSLITDAQVPASAAPMVPLNLVVEFSVVAAVLFVILVTLIGVVGALFYNGSSKVTNGLFVSFTNK
jgi:ABC-type antimicrobial peptide transport system permease subunit